MAKKLGVDGVSPSEFSLRYVCECMRVGGEGRYSVYHIPFFHPFYLSCFHLLSVSSFLPFDFSPSGNFPSALESS